MRSLQASVGLNKSRLSLPHVEDDREVVFRERPPRSLHFALSRMNITVRSKIMSNISCGLNSL
jgi:hypothetical protein